mmetsp:Transcript_22818/g.39103  ORF Transcript_22818/g.39103 Transcript_22818/m.39103 type:complete len:229 (+) Transcript_22818:345-1031(+)|eukprot:CAMPEP_0196654976 /NCGR_PEP_ID=MMETSP1086-20130531/4735_1 /TAXON_ID=77921 /ORGANISM="Cyanoptyche  gloeocystis , Strain SAG4.97" /LENGTH=228 /DNA_ID=CAMNT_0041987045 /DNA_START=339 /DNA_END=1025 /DNA_ORIENTATION=-
MTVGEHLLSLFQDFAAVLYVVLGQANGQVYGQGQQPGRDGPDVEVVHFVDVRYALKVLHDLPWVDARRRRLHQDSHTFNDEPEGREQDQNGKHHRHDRINKGPRGLQVHDEAGDDDPNALDAVANDVDECGPDIDVVTAAPVQYPRDRDVSYKPEYGCTHDEKSRNIFGVLYSLDRRVDEETRQEPDGKGADDGAKNLSAMESEAHLSRAWTLSKPLGEKAQAETTDI